MDEARALQMVRECTMIRVDAEAVTEALQRGGSLRAHSGHLSCLAIHLRDLASLLQEAET